MDEKDHDILIRVETNLSGLCKKIDQIDKDNKTEHKDIKELIDRNYKLSTKTDKDLLKSNTTQVQECNNRFVHTKTFLWIAGFIIMGVIGAYGFTAYVQEDFNKHKITHTQKVEDENRLSIEDTNK